MYHNSASEPGPLTAKGPQILQIAEESKGTMATTSATLLTLPLELRHIIYRELFSSITVSRGFGTSDSHHTSLLLTCKQIHDEAKPFIAPNALFHFRLTRFMLDDLTSYDSQRLQNIRRLRVSAFPFPVYPGADAPFFTTFLFGFVLPMLPGLQLDLLIVDNMFLQERYDDGLGPQVTASDVKCILQFDGWKELHYISPSPKFIHRYTRPKEWLDLLCKRDEGATLEVYIAKEPGVKGGASDVKTRIKLLDELEPDRDSIPVPVDGENGRDMREVLVFAKRGANASYAQDGSELDEGIAKVYPKMSWPELQASDLYVKHYDEDPNSLL